ncbi:MAG: heme-binding protein [Pseudorhodoplanes sp.]
MSIRPIALALALLLPGALPAAAQTQPPYGPPITLDIAKKVMAAAEAEAQKLNLQVAIAILDSGGQLVMMHKFDNTQYASIDVSAGKARTALNFKRPSKDLQDAVTGGGAGLRLVGIKDVIAIEGGLPIVADGKVIGAIGVSGGMAGQDTAVAAAGAAAAGR